MLKPKTSGHLEEQAPNLQLREFLPAQASSPDTLRRFPPQNIEAEQSVLGAILLDNESIKEVIDLLSPQELLSRGASAHLPRDGAPRQMTTSPSIRLF